MTPLANNETFRIADAAGLVGQEIGVSDWLTVDQERVTAFGLATNHDHWLHLDPQRAAAESPFGGTLVQGFLLTGLILHFIADLGLRPADAGYALNYGFDRVRYFTPLAVGDGVRVRDRVSMLGVREKTPGRTLMTTGHIIEADLAGGPTAVASAEWLTLWIIATITEE